MDLVSKAIWFIECHSESDLSLDAIATGIGISRFHLARAFGEATGLSVMRYLRARRLSEAAGRLAGGATEILAVALDAGYNSHEAFTRAFRDEFGITPEALRARGNLEGIKLTEALKMSTSKTKLTPPRFETGRPLLIAGISQRYTPESVGEIPSQWQKFIPYLGKIPGQVGKVAYGVCCNGDASGSFDYICGVEVSEFSGLPAEFACQRISQQKYAVFTHKEHISSIRGTCNAIWGDWLPNSPYEPADSPDFERYDENFNSQTGEGGLEIWVAIK